MNVTPPSSGTIPPLPQRTEGGAPVKPPVRGNTNAGQRDAAVDAMQSRVVENHGFEMKKYTRDALANNTKMINIPVLERGSLLDIKI